MHLGALQGARLWNMRSLIVLATLALLGALALPTVAASHMGPCTHEYVDPIAWGIQNYKTGGLAKMPGYEVSMVVYCLTHPCPGCDVILP